MTIPITLFALILFLDCIIVTKQEISMLLSRFMQNQYLSHYVPIEFLREQPIGECWTRLFMRNGNN